MLNTYFSILHSSECIFQIVTHDVYQKKAYGLVSLTSYQHKYIWKGLQSQQCLHLAELEMSSLLALSFNSWR